MDVTTSYQKNRINDAIRFFSVSATTKHERRYIGLSHFGNHADLLEQPQSVPAIP